jgi:hypothetical protein
MQSWRHHILQKNLYFLIQPRTSEFSVKIALLILGTDPHAVGALCSIADPSSFMLHSRVHFTPLGVWSNKWNAVKRELSRPCISLTRSVLEYMRSFVTERGTRGRKLRRILKTNARNTVKDFYIHFDNVVSSNSLLLQTEEHRLPWHVQGSQSPALAWKIFTKTKKQFFFFHMLS